MLDIFSASFFSIQIFSQHTIHCTQYPHKSAVFVHKERRNLQTSMRFRPLLHVNQYSVNQCPVVFEKRFITTTPQTINKMPIIAGASNDCFNTTTPISAVKIMPTPAQIA